MNLDKTAVHVHLHYKWNKYFLLFEYMYSVLSEKNQTKYYNALLFLCRLACFYGNIEEYPLYDKGFLSLYPTQGRWMFLSYICSILI